MTVMAPGKIILSGEHSVVYGKPALAMAVNRYVIAIASPQKNPLISFDLSDLNYRTSFSLAVLEQLKNRLKNNYQRFKKGESKIQKVLQKPFELAQFVVSLCLDRFNITLPQGLHVRMDSTIPIGCGMGSSAAMIVSLIHSVLHQVGIDVIQETVLQLAEEAENLQHGRSSGLDLKLSLYGGCYFIENQNMIRRSLPEASFYFINTGCPESSTGECVLHAASYFERSTIGNDFENVTKAMDEALYSNHASSNVSEVIRENHQLLVKIGVVPDTVQQCIAGIEKIGGAAKICGAGAVKGEKAGLLLVVIENSLLLKKICDQYHYSLLPLSGESRGVRIVV